MLALIAAKAENNVIGKADTLPWHLPEDLKRFKTLTTGKTVLMGRKTFESIFKRLGKPLPNRKNVVITGQQDYSAPEGVVVFHDLAQALETLKNEEVLVAGGAQIYAQTIDKADKLFITEVHQTIPGDAVFPTIDPAKWKKVWEEPHDGFTFAEYQLKTAN